MRNSRSAVLALTVLLSSLPQTTRAQTPGIGARAVAPVVRQASGVQPQPAPTRSTWSSAVPTAIPGYAAAALDPKQEDEGTHRGRNVLIGVGVGAVAGGIFAATSCNGDCDFSLGLIVAPVGGAAIGALLALLLTPVR